MNISQRKIIHSHTSAFASDHRRAKADDADAAFLCFIGVAGIVFIGAVLKIFGVL